MTHVSIIGTGNMGQAIAGVVGKGGHAVKRAGELEALGFLQITLAANEKVSWTGGFGVIA